MNPTGKSADSSRRLVAVLSSGLVGLVIVGLAATIRVPLLLGSIGALNVGLVITIVSAGQIALVGVAGARSAARVMATEAHHNCSNASRGISLLGNWRWSAAVPLLVFAGVTAVTLPGLTASQSNAEFIIAIVTSCTLSIAAFPGGRAWGELEAQGALASVNMLSALTSLAALGATVVLLQAPYPVLVHSTIGSLSAVGPFFIAQLWFRMKNHPPTIRLPSGAAPLVRLEAIRSLPGLAFRSLDPIILTALGLGQLVADFTIVQRITMMMTGLTVFARPVWSRSAAKLRAEHSQRQVETNHLSSYYRSTLVQAILLGFVGAAGVFMACWAATYFVEFSIDSFWILVALSAVVVFLTALANAFSTFLAGQVAARVGSRIEVGSAIMKVVLTIVLVKSAGAVGAVAATIFALAALTTLEYRVLLRRPDLLADRAVDSSRDG